MKADYKAIEEKTLKVFRNVFNNPTHLDLNSTMDSIERWDSMNHIILIQELEKEFDFKFDLFEIIEIRDVKGMVEYIASKKNP